MTLLEQATDLQHRANGPGILDAVDDYYADDVTVVEATGETFQGRETQKTRIKDWDAAAEQVHGSDIKSVAAYETAPGTGVAFAETATDVTFKGRGRAVLEQVAVQQWADGKIIHERFYYNAPGM